MLNLCLKISKEYNLVYHNDLIGNYYFSFKNKKVFFTKFSYPLIYYIKENIISVAQEFNIIDERDNFLCAFLNFAHFKTIDENKLKPYIENLIKCIEIKSKMYKEWLIKKKISDLNKDFE